MTEPHMGPVVAGVDGSAAALDAVRWAADQARRWGSPLRLVHADVWPLVAPPRGVPTLRDTRSVGWEHGRAALLAATEAAVTVAPDVPVTTEYVVTTATTALVEESRTARLLVVGSRGLGGFTGLLVGSTAVRLTGYARCPVVVVRGTPGTELAGEPADAPAGAGDAPPWTGPVVAGVGGSASDDTVLGFALDQAALRGVPLVAVHAWSDWYLPGPLVADAAPFAWEDAEREAGTVLAERLAGWTDKYPSVELRPVVTPGRPAHSLLRAAAGASLVVVGSRGRGGVTGLLLGSTSHALLHHAPCPVAVVRPDTATR
ncbi:MAG TPA: universal stress protein [Pseudonocardiaceae bacterium]